MKRKSRYQRVLTGKKPIERKEKIEILELLCQFSKLRSTYITALLPHRSQQAQGGVKKTLRLMHNEGLVTKVRQLDLHLPDIYEITDAGIALAEKYGVHTVRYANTKRVEGEGARIMQHHQMMIYDDMANVCISAKKHDIEVIPRSDVIERVTGDTVIDNPMKLGFSGAYTYRDGTTHTVRNGFVIPDELFGLRYPNGLVAVPIRTTDGTLVGYIGINEAKLPTSWK